MPDTLFKQLADGGRLVAPVGREGQQVWSNANIEYVVVPQVWGVGHIRSTGDAGMTRDTSKNVMSGIYFRMTGSHYRPDGSVFAIDWSDTGECHSVKNTRRETGRVYKITYGPSKAEPVDVARRTNEELVRLHLHTNDWHVRHARRVLHIEDGRLVDGPAQAAASGHA